MLAMKTLEQLQWRVSVVNTRKRQHHKMVKRNANELFECVWPFCGVGA